MFTDETSFAAFRLPPASIGVPRLGSDGQLDRREVAEECAIALVYDGTTAAVVMATPSDLRDLAIGFSLTEGIIRTPGEIHSLEIIPCPEGVEARMWLTPDSARQFMKRQRRLTGPTGCGLCGIESLSEAARSCQRLSRSIALAPTQIERAVESLADAQELNRTTRATHAAGFYRPGDGLVAIREDVGRHNALDKLVGGSLMSGALPLSQHVVLLSGRVSFELVQKALRAGVAVLAAIGAPSSLAVGLAATTGLTLVGFLRPDHCNVYTHAERLS